MSRGTISRLPRTSIAWLDATCCGPPTRARGGRRAAVLLLCALGVPTDFWLSKQEIVVHFTTDATAADHARVWALCQHIPNVDPEPVDTTSKYKATLLYNVRYRVDHATNLQLQQLFDCLKQDPTVAATTTAIARTTSAALPVFVGHSPPRDGDPISIMRSTGVPCTCRHCWIDIDFEDVFAATIAAAWPA